MMGSTPRRSRYAIALCKKEPRGDDVCEKLFGNELEAHEVTLSAYCIDRTEVTVAAYRRCVELGRCSAPPYASGGDALRSARLPGHARHLERRRRLLPVRRRAPAHRGRVGARRARRRGTALSRGATSTTRPRATTAHSRLDDTDDSDGFVELAPVGSFPAGRTPDGIDDMAGNVEEWVADAIDDVDAHYPTRAR